MIICIQCCIHITAKNDFIKSFNVGTLIAGNGNVLSNSPDYYNKSYYRTFNQAYATQTATAGNFLVNDGATSVRLTSKSVSVYLLKNGDVSLTNGGGLYWLDEVS